MLTETLEQKNEKALRKANLAESILSKIRDDPKLYYAHDPTLSAIGEPRQNKFFIMNTLTEIMEMYMTESPEVIPAKVQSFVNNANSFLYGGSN